MRNIFFAIIGFALLCAASCCKPDEKCPITVIEPELYDYAFATGSYWVYINDSTGILDTITVIDAIDTVYLFNEPTAYGHYVQLFKTTFYRSSTADTFSELTHTLKIFRSDDFRVGFDCPDSIQGEICSQAIFVSASALYSAEIFKYLEKIQTLSLYGNAYSNVKHFWTKGADYCSSTSFNDLHLFYAPNIGLIKFEEVLPSGVINSFSLTTKNVTRHEIKNPCN